MPLLSDPSRLRRALTLGAVGAIAAAVVVALVAGGGADEPSTPAAETSPSAPEESPSNQGETLDESAAIREFTRLHDLAQELSSNRDVNFTNNVFTRQGPMWHRARSRINELLNDRVLDHSTVEVVRVQVEDLAPGEASVVATTVTSPCFVTEQGKDVTEDERVIQQSVHWTLRIEGGVWKLHDAELRDQQEVDKPRRQCA